MHKEIIIILVVGIGAFIAYTIYNKPPKEKIIPAQVKETEASIQQKVTESPPLSFSKQVQETFNFITFQDSGQALARTRW